MEAILVRLEAASSQDSSHCPGYRSCPERLLHLPTAASNLIRPPRGNGGRMRRSQANTAKVLEGNPTLMRLRELEVLERVATSGKLNVVLGEKGLAERVVNLL